MDVQDGERLRMEIILMELQKVKNLLVKVREKISTTSNVNNNSNNDSEGYNNTYDEAVLVDYLNVRLKEAMGRLQRLKQRFQAVG